MDAFLKVKGTAETAPDDHEDEAGPSTSTPPKKGKRLCTFRPVWQNEYKWILKGPDDFSARCRVCNKNFAISHGGISDVKQHLNTKEHKKRQTAESSSQALTSFFTNKNNTVESNCVTRVELAETFHCVKHSQSYNSLDCGLKLLQKAIKDSEIVKKISCGRTKAEAIVQNVLSQKSVEDILKTLQPTSDNQAAAYFSVATDTSNKGNRKMYPICIRYFTAENGIECKLLDFFEEPSETADTISQSILKTLQNFNLDIKNVASFSADNTNANFGKNRSCFTLLREKNSRILKNGCPAHIVNNTFKHAANQLSIDIEVVVLKIYSHFSSSSLRRENLKEFVEFVNLEYQEILKHVPTRWLSLGPAIERILKFYPALISYFISIGDECPLIIKKLLGINEDETDVQSYL